MAPSDEPWPDRTAAARVPGAGDGVDPRSGDGFRTRRERRAAEAAALGEPASGWIRPAATPTASLNGHDRSGVGSNGLSRNGHEVNRHEVNGHEITGHEINGYVPALPPRPPEDLFSRASTVDPATPADTTAPLRPAHPSVTSAVGPSDAYGDWAAGPQRPGGTGRGGAGTGDGNAGMGDGSGGGDGVASPMPGGGSPARPTLGRRLLRDAREILGTVAIALGIAIVIKTFLIQPFYIPSQSMESTLAVGDRVLVSKLEPGPLELNRGDVAVFVDPGGWLTETRPEPSVLTRTLTFVGLLPANSGEHLIKRVIGLPGDTVKCCDPEGRLLVNNQPIDEGQYLFPGDSPSTLEFEVVVPDGTVWVMGDHRSVSEDSRYHDVDGDYTAGAVPIDNVVGRAVLVMWPRFEWLGQPEGVFDGVGGQFDGVR